MTRHRALLAGIVAAAIAVSLGACAAPLPPPAPLVISQPRTQSKTDARPRHAARTAVQKSPLSDTEKAALFKQFDDWEDSRKGSGDTIPPSASASP